MDVIDISPPVTLPTLPMTPSRSHRKPPPTLPLTDTPETIASSVSLPPTPRIKDVEDQIFAREEHERETYSQYENLHTSRGYPQTQTAYRTRLEEADQHQVDPGVISANYDSYATTAPRYPAPTTRSYAPASGITLGEDGGYHPPVRFSPPHPASPVPPMYFRPRDQRMSDIVESLGSSQRHPGAGSASQDVCVPAPALDDSSPTNSCFDSDSDVTDGSDSPASPPPRS